MLDFGVFLVKAQERGVGLLIIIRRWRGLDDGGCRWRLDDREDFNNGKGVGQLGAVSKLRLAEGGYLATHGKVDEHVQSTCRSKQEDTPCWDLEVDLVLGVTQDSASSLHAPLCEGVKHLRHRRKGKVELRVRQSENERMCWFLNGYLFVLVIVVEERKQLTMMKGAGRTSVYGRCVLFFVGP